MWDTNVCFKFYGNPSNTCRDISFKTTNVKFDLLVALYENLGDHKSRQDSSFVLYEYLHQITSQTMQQLSSMSTSWWL